MKKIEIIILTIMVMRATSEVTEYNSTGIIFQTIGDTYLYEGMWKVISIENMANYTNEVKQIEGYQQYLEKIMKDTRFVNIANEIETLKREFSNLIESIKEVNQIITGKNSQNRNKRSLISPVGTLIQTLFGNPDEETMEEYQEKLKKLNSENKEILISIKEQTILTEKIAQNTKKKYEQNE